MRNTIIFFEDLTGKHPEVQISLKEIIIQIEYSVVDNESNKTELLENNINLCTTHVTYIRGLFSNNATFNLHISYLNTSSIIELAGMNHGAELFNAELDKWKTSKVNSISAIFRESIRFNCDKSKWNTSNVTRMSYILRDTSAFN